MSNGSKAGLVIVIALIAFGLWYGMRPSDSTAGGAANVKTDVTPTSAPESASDDVSISDDISAVDAGLNAIDQDSSAVDEGLNDKPVSQTE